ncbi:DUF1365 domain-containing protein [Ideonella sp. YS5]|uniref:DUF1365 domain-containing protein n=1 Tax=Ideonella sp. YS5 TaxID=3453714 RepID=UPI003EED5010
MQSAIYSGWLEHRRFAPRPHAFRYRLFMVCLDLAELDRVFAGRWLWSTTRRAPARFDRRDHFGDPALSLDESVRRLVQEQTGTRPTGPIRLLTHLRYWGYVFNPVSFFYCLDAGGERIEAVVAEVNNTPWGERHCYVLPGAAQAGGAVRAHTDKAMHVSPFHPMELRYAWHLGHPGEALDVAMALRRTTGEDAAAPLFSATLRLHRVPISAASLAGALLRFPWMTLQVIAAIHWQALRLWLKRTPVHDHPAPRAAGVAPTRSQGG